VNCPHLEADCSEREKAAASSPIRGGGGEEGVARRGLELESGLKEGDVIVIFCDF